MISGHKSYGWAFMVLLVVILSSCVLPARIKAKKNCDDPQNPVWVVNHGYHTSVVVPVTNFPDIVVLDSAFTAYNFIEFAWGDSSYYMAPDPGISEALKALFVPSASVFHVVVFNEVPEKYFSKLPVKQVNICNQELEALQTYFLDSFHKNDQKKALFLGRGLYGISGFYLSNRKYHLFYTCNNWVVSGLRKAGQVTPIWSPFSWPVMWYL